MDDSRNGQVDMNLGIFWGRLKKISLFFTEIWEGQFLGENGGVVKIFSDIFNIYGKNTHFSQFHIYVLKTFCL